jgi:hypothetical protein
MKANRFPALPLAIAMTLIGCALAETASAQFAMGPRRFGGVQWRMQQRIILSPTVQVVRPRGADRFLQGGSRQTIYYSAMRGSVSHIEVRSGRRTLQTIALPPGARSGRIGFTTPVGVRDFKLRAWQGMPGYRSVSGESIKYTLVR